MGDVVTTTGPKPSETLGITLTHEHIFMDLVGGGRSRDKQNRNHMLNDLELSRRELMLFKEAGGKTIVDLTSNGMKVSEDLLGTSHPLAIKDLALKTDLNIVLGTGWYTEPYYKNHIYQMTVNEIADELTNDFTHGIGNTDVRAGILGEIGSATTWVTPAEERILRATARAQQQVGVAIATHTSGWKVGLQQLDILEEEGVDLRRVIIGHCQLYRNIEYHIEIAQRGAFISLEGLGTTNDYEKETYAYMIKNIIDAGFIKQLLLSHNVSLREHYVAYGGKGYEYILTEAQSDSSFSLTEKQFHQIMVDNPRRALSGDE